METIKHLVELSKSTGKSLSSYVFELAGYLERDSLEAVAQEFAALFDDSRENELIEQLKEYHPTQFELED